MDENSKISKSRDMQIIMQDDVVPCFKYASIPGIPFEVPNDAVVNLLSRFGNIKDKCTLSYKISPKFIATGTRKIKIIIKKRAKI